MQTPLLPFQDLHHLPFYLLVVLLNIYGVWRKARKRARLNDWASRKGYRILQLERPWIIAEGPFAWTTMSRSNPIYRIKVIDELGEMRAGWVRTARLRLTVRWDSGEASEEKLPGPKGLMKWSKILDEHLRCDDSPACSPPPENSNR
jgi:hypothetical protein